MIGLPASVNAQWHAPPYTCSAAAMLSVPAVPQFWRTDRCFTGDLIHRAVVTSTRHGVYEDTNMQAHSLPAYHMHFQYSRKTQTQRTHNETAAVSQHQWLRQTTNHTKRQTALPSCDNSTTLILPRNCVLPKRPCLFITSARGRNLGCSLRGVRRRPSSGLHRLVCWHKITNGREILPGSRFPRSTGILQDPNWDAERHNKSFHMNWICGIRAHFSQITLLFPCQKDSTSPPY